jgi:transposase
MNVTTVGIDLAKNSFSLHGVDSRGKMVFRKTLARAKRMPFLAGQLPCLIGMEACSGAHYWGRELTKYGHRVCRRVNAPIPASVMIAAII